MRFTCAKTICVLSVVVMVMPAGFASARSARAQVVSRSITVNRLGVAKPAILVGNPFYELTDRVRGMSVRLASGKTGKVSALLDLLDRKAAELITTESVAPDNAKLISRAVTEYQLVAYQFAVAAGQLSASDLDSDDAAAFADKVIDTVFTNLQLIDEHLAAGDMSVDQAVLSDVFVRLADATVRMFSEVIGFDSVRIRLLVSGDDADLDTVRTAEMSAALAKRAAAVNNNDAARQLLSLRGAILDAVADRIGDDISPADIGALSGSHSERIQTVSYLLGKKNLGQNADLINLRNRFLIEVFAK